MTVTLPKGGNLLLSEEAPGVQRVRIGLGWSQEAGSTAVDLDVLIGLVGDASPGGRLLLAQQVPNPEEPVMMRPADGPLVGDAEKLVVTLADVPPAVSRLLFGVAIFDAVGRRQTFRSIRGAYIRVLDDANGNEIARYALDQETGAETAMVFGELYRNPRGWKFRAVGQGYANGLRGIAGKDGADPQIARPLEVTGFVRRGSPTRSRRTVAEHLNPPKAPAAPAATAPIPSRPSTPPPARPAQAPRPTQPAARPVAPAPPKAPQPPPARPARPAPQAQPARPAARSTLDLSGDEEAQAASTTQASAAPSTAKPAAHIEFGEHSSRYRQRLEHVTALDDDHPVTTWTESDRGTGGMTITLRWEPLLTASGLPRPSDLQLGCFWQAVDGSVGILQSLGNAISAPGALGPRQVLRLGRRDEREGQTIFVDFAALPTFRRFFVFAYGQHGSPEWAVLRPVLTVAAQGGEQLTIRFGDAPQSARICVAASFHVAQGDLIIRRENDYLDGLQAEAAARYGWTFEWNPDRMTFRAPL